ncbi:ROK family protein [Malonomonas rubra]|uniref:ROK family protein n=1 Tax=Malonomonas rubra TaxID=57040 RepID=UPI0026EAEFA8|nr:ROK family protein [Malonomonas rubra]
MRIGIDLGGTKTEIIVLDEQGEIRLRRRVPTIRGDYDATLRSLHELVTSAETEIGHRCSVGIGIPGVTSPATGLIKNANSTWLIGKPFEEDLQKLLQRPLHLANDANCFALSEAVDGAAAGAQNVFGVILGTGVGGGIVIDGKVLNGCNAIAGEWGHNPLPWPQAEELPGPKCYCGRCGCIETFLSGPGLMADHLLHTGQKRSGEEIATRTEGAASLRRHAHRLARALASVINLLDPDFIVLGGGLSNIESLYSEVPKLWQMYVFSDQVTTRLVRNLHGDSSGVRGAAWLWPSGSTSNNRR